MQQVHTHYRRQQNTHEDEWVLGNNKTTFCSLNVQSKCTTSPQRKESVNTKDETNTQVVEWTVNRCFRDAAWMVGMPGGSK